DEVENTGAAAEFGATEDPVQTAHAVGCRFPFRRQSIVQGSQQRRGETGCYGMLEQRPGPGQRALTRTRAVESAMEPTGGSKRKDDPGHQPEPPECAVREIQ